MENPFAEKLALLNRPDYGRLSFEDQCGFYAALILHLDPDDTTPEKDRRPIPPEAIAKVAGITRGTVSLLAAAGAVRGGQLRYPKVAREYAALGHEPFVHKYLTPLIRERLMEALDDIRVAERNPDINALGFSPRANGYCRRYDWPKTSLSRHAVFRIELHPDAGGYFWRDLKPRYNQPEVPYDRVAFNPECAIVGDPSRGPERGPDAKGYPTSELCYRHCKRLFDPTAKQIGEVA